MADGVLLAPLHSQYDPDTLRAHAFEASTCPTLLFTPGLVLLDCNEAYARITGRTAAQLRGRQLFEAITEDPGASPGAPEFERCLRASVGRVLATAQADTMPELRRGRSPPDGPSGLRCWRVVNAPVIVDGRIVAIRQDHHDATAELRETERRDALERVAGTLARTGFWTFDPRSGAVHASAACEALFGFAPDPCSGAARPVWAYARRVVTSDRAAVIDAVEALVSEGVGSVRQIEFTARGPAGGSRRAAARAEVVADTDGAPILAGITLDTTDIQAGEQRLARLLGEKQALLEEVNHRVKNSLQLVSAILSLEARRAGQTGEGRHLHSAARRVQAVAAVHASLHQGAHVTSVRLDQHLAEFCDRLADSLGAHERGIALHVEVPKIALPAAQAVPLSLVVNELVTNAFKHAFPQEAPDGAWVRVAVRREAGGRNALIVEDNGAGASADTGSASGGLGSQLVASLVAQLGGEMRQERAEGWRSVVTFPAVA